MFQSIIKIIDRKIILFLSIIAFLAISFYYVTHNIYYDDGFNFYGYNEYNYDKNKRFDPDKWDNDRLSLLLVWLNQNTHNNFKNINELKELTHLNISKSQLIQVPIWLIELKNLKSIHAEENKITDFLKYDIKYLQNLEEIDLSSNKLKEIPIGIHELKYLKKLNVALNEINEIPEWMKNNQSLTFFNICVNKIKELPFWIKSLNNLEELYLCDNPTMELPSSLGDFSKLKILSISNVNLPNSKITKTPTIPEFIFKLNQLEVLSANENKLKFISENISNLKNLKKLDVSVNEFSEFPNQINELKNLELLSMSFNHLNKLPKNITNLKQLKLLDLSNNEFSEFPEHLSKLNNLQSLMIANSVEYQTSLNTYYQSKDKFNRFSNLPLSILKLNQLELLLIEFYETPSSCSILLKLLTNNPNLKFGSSDEHNKMVSELKICEK